MEVGEGAAEAVKGSLKLRGTYIREVILENFMSHEYSRIPLKPGVNLITGPKRIKNSMEESLLLNSIA